MATSTTTKQATDTYIAQRYISDHWNDTMYARGQWYRYAAGVWLAKHDLEIDHEVWQLMELLEAQSQCRPTNTKKNSALARIRARLFIHEVQVDADDGMINLQNGVYSMQDGNIYPHEQKYYMTTQLPFLYDSNATAPIWQMFLLSTFVKPNSIEPDHELIEFVQEAMGYSLTTSVKHHVTFWCIGEGSNGKGVLFHVLEQLAGPGAMSLNVGLLKREQYQLAMLAGKRIALCSESSATQNLVEDALIKALVAGDTMNVRMIRKEPFMLHPTCKLWWAMNSFPAVADSSNGFWRRVRMIPFNRQFDENERILDLKQRLDTELPGIFNWVMQGLKRLRDRDRFVVPAQVEAQTQEQKQESNPVELFCLDRLGGQQDQDQMSLISLVYTEYKTWCFDNGYKPLSSGRLKKEMARLKHPAHKIARGTVYWGVEVKL